MIDTEIMEPGADSATMAKWAPVLEDIEEVFLLVGALFVLFVFYESLFLDIPIYYGLFNFNKHFIFFVLIIISYERVCDSVILQVYHLIIWCLDH